MNNDNWIRIGAIPSTVGGTTEGVSNHLNVISGLYSPRLIAARLIDGRIEMIYRQLSMTSNNWGQMPDRAWKEIYEARDGKIVLAQTIRGEIVPAVGERVLFEDGDTQSI